MREKYSTTDIKEVCVSRLREKIFCNFHLLNRMMTIVKLLIEKLLNLNFFLDSKTFQEQNIKKIRDQVLATRLYLLLFFIIATVFLLFNSLITRFISVTTLEPSIDTYDRLYAAYPNTLSCPCSVVATPYSTFITMNSVQHPVRIAKQLRTVFNHTYKGFVNGLSLFYFG